MMPVYIDNDLIIGLGKTTIIAEVGINHNGDVELAKRMIETAWENGADLIKLQSFVTENFFAHDLPYFKSTKALELSFEEQGDLFAFARQNNIRLFTTPFDRDTLEFLDDFDLPVYKIASMDCNNYCLIQEVAKRQKPVIFSTGMATIEEIEKALEAVYSTGNEKVVLMHCVSAYPPDPHDIQLQYMYTLQKKFDVPCGFSDHAVGMDAAYLSVGLGASVIEKHFTMEREIQEKYSSADHKVSMTPPELKKISHFCRQAELMRGNGKRYLTETEQQGRECFRRGLYARSDIKEGELLTKEKLIDLRPVRNMSVSMLDQVVGKRALRSFKDGESISEEGIGYAQ